MAKQLSDQDFLKKELTTVLVKLDKTGLVTVTLNRPDVHNAFNPDMIAELTSLFESFETDDRVHFVLLRGNGKSFSAGADLNWMKSMKGYTFDENYSDSQTFARMFESINKLTKPVIAAVHGAALGGGMGFISVVDYCLATEDVKLGFSETKLGLVPGVISPFVISKIGPAWARATFLNGERFGVDLGQKMGLIHRVCEPSHFEESIQDVIKRFLSAAPGATRQAKRLIQTVCQMKERDFPPAELRDQLRDFSCQTIAQARVSDEAQEGMTALLEKRKPNWK